MGLSGLVEVSPLVGKESWLLSDSSDCREVMLSLVVSSCVEESAKTSLRGASASSSLLSSSRGHFREEDVSMSSS